MNEFYICRHCKKMFHGSGPYEDPRDPCPDRKQHPELAKVGVLCCHWSQSEVKGPPTSALERKARKAAQVL